MAHRQATKTAHYLPLARPFPLAFAVSPLCISNCTANYIQQTGCQLVADEDGEEVEVGCTKVQGSKAEEKSHSHVFCSQTAHFQRHLTSALLLSPLPAWQVKTLARSMQLALCRQLWSICGKKKTDMIMLVMIKYA